jgi:hypothetical protein
MRCAVHFFIEGRPELRVAVEDKEFAELLGERLCVESSEHHLRPSLASHQTIIKILHLVGIRREYDRDSVRFLWEAPLSAATFDRFWTLVRADDAAHVSSLVSELQAADLEEMDVAGDEEAAEWLRHAYEHRPK